ncbi:EAL domain-containing protein [Arthrobacter sp. QXT-31]|uniref:EAL domain-containing protein n=1 Tax=Arthrobacter sp. QXT-31 TaxID=1357915 RepID=UPI0009718E16|nr:hypothetical protein BWQ92_00040 [Arthrobacter sp. QXT-31]
MLILENAAVEPARIMLELTERIQPGQLRPLLDALRPLRRSGMGLAVDEAGPDAASMRNIRVLKPDVSRSARTLSPASTPIPAASISWPTSSSSDDRPVPSWRRWESKRATNWPS